MKQNLRTLILFTAALLGVTIQQSSGTEYTTNLELTRYIGRELWTAMDPGQRRLFPSNCVTVAEDAEPWVKPVEIRDSSVAGRYVAVSRGFIDLMNNISHAKAIDQFESGYFQRYLNQLANETGRFPLERVPGVYDDKYWRKEIVNEQESNFNQMVALVLAIQLSHHGLGHYDKHQLDLEDPRFGQPINQLLRGPEWTDAFQAGLELALHAGYGVEGFETLCEALDRMPRRPTWTNYFLPRRVDVSGLEDKLERSEREFFNFFSE